MAQYVSVPGVSEPVFTLFTDWLGYLRDDGGMGYILKNGVIEPGSYTTLLDKPSTYPPTIGTTATTAKAGNYTPTWAEISSVIPASATFMPVVGTSALTAKAGNWFPSWGELLGVPSTFTPSAHTHALSDVTGLTAALAGKFAVPTGTTSQYIRGDGSLATMPVASTPSDAYPTRTLGTAFQPSSTRTAMVTYSVQINVTASIAGGQNGDVFLEIADDSAFTTNVRQVAVVGLGQTYTLAVAIQGVQPQTGVIQGVVPAGKWARLRSVNNTGTPTYSIRLAQEVLL